MWGEVSMATEHKYTKANIKQMAKDEDVKWIRLDFISTLGKMKRVEVPAYQLDNVLENKTMFDGSSIAGYVPIEASDLYLHPDLSTWMVIPWSDPDDKVARLICDVYKTDGTPFMGDPRNVLKHEMSKVKKDGYNTFNVGLEPEFFLFKRDENGKPTLKPNDKISYFDISPSDEGAKCRRDIARNLIKVGIHIEAAHHEVAPGQDEIDFRFSDAVNTADNIELFKEVAKHFAKKHGFYATFMPKPLNSVNGSGMHINMSLLKNGKNDFYDPKDKLQLSSDAYKFIGGILKHAKGFTALGNATVNSYKRLIPGFEAPVYIAWSPHNRTALVRVPSDRGIATRLELRSADLSSNPYMALTGALAAGLDGIKNDLQAEPQEERNIFKMNAKDRKAAHIDNLPSNLGDALKDLEKDSVLKDALGSHLLKAYVSLKRQDVLAYQCLVSDWERKHYLDV